MNIKSFSGVTLIELLIVLVILGILAVIAYPSYTKYVTDARRTDGQTALLDLAARMERYYAEHNTYATATVGAGNSATDALSSNLSPEGWYSLSISAANGTTYTLQATPQNAQAAADVACGNLTLNNLGTKGRSGGAALNQCW